MPSPLKKIQDLIYQGMVLDDHGTWIPLAEKIRKEKNFLRHLEQGEILVDGTWCRFTDLPRLSDELDETRDVRHMTVFPPAQQQPEVPVAASRLVPEETVSFSTETLRDFTLPPKTPEPSPAPEEDFPPETRVFSITKPPQPPSSDRTVIGDGAADQMVTGETQAFIIPGRQASPPADRQDAAKPATEYQETVLYNTRLLKKPETTTTAPAAKPLVAAKAAAVPRTIELDEDDHLLRKRSPPFWLIMLISVAGIVALAAIWLFS